MITSRQANAGNAEEIVVIYGSQMAQQKLS